MTLSAPTFSVEARTGILFSHSARLSDTDLLLFREPRGWRTIITTPGSRYGDEPWWRSAIIDADEAGRGLLTWDKKARRWSLSARGWKRLGLEKE